MKNKINCKICGLDDSYFNNLFYLGICGACYFKDELDDLKNKKKRKNDLLTLLSENRNSNSYDCIVPVRGDAEDYYIINFLLKNKLNPYVVLVNNFFLTDLAWQNFHNMTTYFDVDSNVFNPNLKIYKELVRTSLRKLNTIYYPYKLLLHSYVMNLAKQKKIKLVIWGQCQPIEFSGKFSKLDNLKISEWWIIEHELNGVNFDELTGNGAQLTDKDINIYRYHDAKYLKNIYGIFLSNYMPWDQGKIGLEALEFGFTPGELINTVDPNENTGSSVYYQLHDLLRLVNTGHPKLSQQFAREIRYGRLSKKNLNKNINKYLAYDIKSFFTNFLETTTSGYDWFLENKLTSYKHLIKKNPELKVPKHLKKNKLNKKKEDFILFMKGI